MGSDGDPAVFQIQNVTHSEPDGEQRGETPHSAYAAAVVIDSGFPHLRLKQVRTGTPGRP